MKCVDQIFTSLRHTITREREYVFYEYDYNDCVQMRA